MNGMEEHVHTGACCELILIHAAILCHKDVSNRLAEENDFLTYFGVGENARLLGAEFLACLIRWR